MSLYIAFALECELKKNLPQKVVETFEFLCNTGKYNDRFESPPDHPFFKTDVWEAIFDKGKFTFNDTKEAYFLKVKGNSKDYLEQIQKFLHWIAPYSKSKGVVGFVHPDYDRVPSRILFEKGYAYLIDPVENFPELEEYSRPPLGKRATQMIEGLRELAQDNPNLTPMIVQQIKAAETLGGKKG